MRYRIRHGDDAYHVEIQEIGPHLYDVTVDDAETVRVDAYKTPRTVYSVLLGSRQLEGSVDVRDDGTLGKLDVQKGDRILFGQFAGTEVTLDGTEHLIMREDDVLGILK